MKLKAILITLLLSLGFTNVYASSAGAGHSHTASKSKIERNAKNKLNAYISSKKVDASWKNAKIIEIRKDKKDWIVSFKNEDLLSQNILSVFLTSYGKVKGANFN